MCLVYTRHNTFLQRNLNHRNYSVKPTLARESLHAVAFKRLSYYLKYKQVRLINNLSCFGKRFHGCKALPGERGRGRPLYGQSVVKVIRR